jgi:hypothetical protein
MQLVLPLLKFGLEAGAFVSGVTACVLLLFATLGLVIYGRDPLTPRLFFGALVFGLIFLLLAGARVLLG